MSATTKQSESLTKAKNIVYRMLNVRPRSEKEICERLQQKNLSDSDVHRTVIYFKELDLIDDRQFARQWIASRLRKPMGPRRIRLELQQKGIAEDIISEEMAALTEAFPEEEAIAELIRHRTSRYRDTDPQKRKRRLMDFLQRRGFHVSTIIKVINEYDS